jgi:hypothetical protein
MKNVTMATICGEIKFCTIDEFAELVKINQSTKTDDEHEVVCFNQMISLGMDFSSEEEPDDVCSYVRNAINLSINKDQTLSGLMINSLNELKTTVLDGSEKSLTDKIESMAVERAINFGCEVAYLMEDDKYKYLASPDDFRYYNNSQGHAIACISPCKVIKVLK